MTTGSYWNVVNPAKPTGLIDPDEVKRIPYDFSEWLAGESATYASHTLEHGDEIEVTDVGVLDGVIVVSVSPTASAELGMKYPVTVLCTASDGQKKSQTLYYKVKEL